MKLFDRLALSNIITWYIILLVMLFVAAVMLIPSFCSNVWKYGGNTATLMLKLNLKELKAYAKLLLPFQSEYPIMETYKRVKNKAK